MAPLQVAYGGGSTPATDSTSEVKLADAGFDLYEAVISNDRAATCNVTRATGLVQGWAGVTLEDDDSGGFERAAWGDMGDVSGRFEVQYAMDIDGTAASGHTSQIYVQSAAVGGDWGDGVSYGLGLYHVDDGAQDTAPDSTVVISHTTTIVDGLLWWRGVLDLPDRAENNWRFRFTPRVNNSSATGSTTLRAFSIRRLGSTFAGTFHAQKALTSVSASTAFDIASMTEVTDTLAAFDGEHFTAPVPGVTAGIASVDFTNAVTDGSDDINVDVRLNDSTVVAQESFDVELAAGSNHYTATIPYAVTMAENDDIKIRIVNIESGTTTFDYTAEFTGEFFPS